MLDNLREETSFQPDDETNPPDSFDKPRPRIRRKTVDQVTGTTGLQRFVLTFMLFTMVCLIGVLVLVVTGKVILPW
jgi:ABC-type Na+ efflux pump permease subunit